MTSVANNSGKSLFAWGFLMFVIFIILSYPSWFYFANDDYVHIPLSGGKNFGQAGMMRILSEFTLFVDYFFWNKNAFGYHLTNLFFHLFNVILVFYCSRLVIRKYSSVEEGSVNRRCLVVAVLFLVYPFHAEAIYWVIGRGALLGCMFTLLSIIFYLDRSKSYKFFLSVLFFIGGLFAYETIYVLPLMMIILFYFGKEEKGKSGFLGYVNVGVYWIVFLLFLACKFFSTQTILDQYTSGNIIQLNITQLFYNLFLLLGRSVILPLSSSVMLSILFFLFAVTMTLLYVYIFRTNRKAIIFLIMIFLFYGLSLLPVVSLGIDSHDSESGRFLYLPAVFLILLGVETVIAMRVSAVVRKGALLFVSVYFTGCLMLFAGQYRQSANIARLSLGALKTNASYRNLYAVGLPSQYGGATIFRREFDHALQWIQPTLKFDSLIIISTREVMKKVPFRIVTGNIEFFRRYNAGIVSTSDSAILIQAQGQKSYQFIPGKDLLLCWTDSSLSVIQ